MRHWAFTLDAARSIVRSKANEMNNERNIMAIIVACIVLSAVVEIFKLLKPKPEAQHDAGAINLASLPPGSIIVLPKGSE